MLKNVLQTDGRCCYYCYRVWAQTAGAITLGKYKVNCGGDEALADRHKKYLHWMIGKLEEEWQNMSQTPESREVLYYDCALRWPAKFSNFRLRVVDVCLLEFE